MDQSLDKKFDERELNDFYQAQAISHQQESIFRDGQRRKEMFDLLKERRHKEQDVYSQLRNDLQNQLRQKPHESETIVEHDLWETEEDAVKNQEAENLFA